MSSARIRIFNLTLIALLSLLSLTACSSFLRQPADPASNSASNNARANANVFERYLSEDPTLAEPRTQIFVRDAVGRNLFPDSVIAGMLPPVTVVQAPGASFTRLARRTVGQPFYGWSRNGQE